MMNYTIERGLISLLLLFLSLHAVPVHADCVAATPEVIKTSQTDKYGTLYELPLKDKGGPGKAVFRYDKSEAKEHTPTLYDVLLYRADGTVNDIAPLIEDPILGDDVKTIALSTKHDSIYMDQQPLTADSAGIYMQWSTILDPITCEWIAIQVDRLANGPFPKINEVNTSDPRFTKEAAYLRKLNSDVITPEMVTKDRSNPKWAQYVWALDNPGMLHGEKSGTLKLQWYPCDEKSCEKSPSDLTWNTYRIRDQENNSIPTEKILFNDERKEWAYLFAGYGWKGMGTDDSAPYFTGSVLHISPAVHRFAVDLKTFAWKQEPSPAPSFQDFRQH